MAAVSLASSGLLPLENASAATVPATAPRQSAAGAAASPVQQEIDAKFANIVRKYSDRLSEAQRQRLRRVLGENERMLAAVRAFPLENGDPPAQVLKLTDSEYDSGGPGATGGPEPAAHAQPHGGRS